MSKKKKAKKIRRPAVTNEESVVSRFRNRIMSDERVKYIYSERESIIHDKHCQYSRDIPDSDLFYVSHYLPSMKQCAKCAMRAYVNAGAKDPENYGMYQKLFKQFKITVKQLRHMYVDCNMQTEAFPNKLKVKDREDTWQIKVLSGRGQVCLYHNNYHVDKDGKRVFDKGYHIQSEYLSRTTIDKAIEAIETYSYSKHCNAVQANEVISNSTSSEMKKNGIWHRMLQRSSKGIGAKLRKWLFHTKKTEAEEMFGIQIDQFKLVSKDGYPKDGERCIYIWENKDGEQKWQVGVYEWSNRAFSVQFGNNHFITDKSKVVAWKRIDSTKGIVNSASEIEQEEN